MNNHETTTADERLPINRRIDRDDVWQQQGERQAGHNVRSTNNLCTGDNLCSADDMCPADNVRSQDHVFPAASSSCPPSSNDLCSDDYMCSDDHVCPVGGKHELTGSR